MRRLALLTVLALGVLLLLAAPASAHVTVSSPDATRGGYAVVAFRVPTESATASTTKLVVQLPRRFDDVAVQPLTGWTAEASGSQLTWTAQSGYAIKPGQFQQFFVQLGPLPDAPSVTFKAVQTYSDGSVVRWIETAAPGSKAEPEHPAPVLTLAAAADESAAPVKAAGGSSNTGPVVLSIIALVVAAGALGMSLVNRARSRS